MLNQQEKKQEEEQTSSLTAQLRKVQALVSGEFNAKNNVKCNCTTDHPSVTAISVLENLQDEVQRYSLFSKNESLEDVQNSSLELISIEYHLAQSYLQLPTTSSRTRNNHVIKALELFHLFLGRCDGLEGLLQDSVTKEYRSILTALDESASSENGNLRLSRDEMSSLPFTSRDAKIARYHQAQQLKTQSAHLNALLYQRDRLKLACHEDLEGHDEYSLRRSLSISQLNSNAIDSLDELNNSTRELEMLKMSTKMENERNTMKRYVGDKGEEQVSASHMPSSSSRNNFPVGASNTPLQFTHITQDATTGQLLFRKEQIRSSIFRPSWNQPTMTIEQFAEKEVSDAILRSERQKKASEEAKKAPRRYEQLVQDMMEDDVDLVDASAALDRKWDDWKDENPKGSGNKMGDVGDRNF